VSITNYSELQTAVARWLKRDDLTALIPDYIQLGENRLWHGDEGQFKTKPLRIKLMQETETGTIASQVITYPFATNGAGTVYFTHLETQRLSVTSGGDTWALRYLPPQQFAEKEAATGDPQYYTFLNNQIKTAPSNALAYTHDYYRRFASLSVDDTGNVILTNYPELYLFAACIEGALDIMSDSMAARFASRLQARINALQSSQGNSMAGGSLAVTIGR
jgi:hypothetical protein